MVGPINRMLGIGLGAGLLVGGASLAPASIIINYATGFETDAPGSAAAGNPAGWEAPNGAGASVVTGSSTNGSGTNQQVYQVNYTGNSAWWFQEVKFADLTAATAPVIHAGLKVQVNGTSDARLTLGANTIISYLRITGSKFQYHNGTAWNDLASLTQGKWYQVNETIDMVNKTVAITIDNLDDALPPVYSGTGLTWYNPTTAKMNAFVIARVSGSTQNFQLDDLSISIPEPATAGLMALGGSLVLMYRRAE